MNFVISSATLTKHLQSISGVLTSKNTLPILDNFLFEITDGRLTVSASDLETTMQTTLELTESDGPGSIAIPAKLLLEVLKNLPDQPCTFVVDLETYGIEIVYENGRSKMVGFNGSEFPKIPLLEESQSVTLKGDIIATAIGTTMFAAGNDILRQIMSGIYCGFSPQEVVFAATDSQKLVRYKRFDSTANSSSSFILPKKPLTLLRSNLSDDVEVKIDYNESNAVFSFGDIVLICRLIDGNYPPFDTVIPKETGNIMTIDRVQFLAALRRVSIFSSKTNHKVRFSFAGSQLSLLAQDIDYNNEATERITCHYQGEDRYVSFNAVNLMEMLSILSSKEVCLEMEQADRPGILRPSENKENEDIIMLVMPLKDDIERI